MESALLVVTEPRDFQSKDGKKFVRGAIMERESHYVLFKSNELLTFGQVSGYVVRLTTPYDKTGDALFDLIKGAYVTGELLVEQDSNGNPINTSGGKQFVFVLEGSVVLDP